METRRVNVYLRTQLFRFKYVYDGEERQLLDNAVRIQGTVVRETQAGVHIAVEQISNLRVVETELPFKELFVPFDKVDHIIFLD